ncbi:MAG: hypothetical protein IPL46_03760 [Saprospiraceae bacterium]|nr:hypothetical protein [Saprospiraceae bacterium]
MAYVGGNPDGAVGGIRVTAVQTSFTGISNLIDPMINNSSIQKWHRLKQKDLDQQFIHKVIEGCGCSSFEAKAIQQTVYQVYAPFFDRKHFRVLVR